MSEGLVDYRYKDGRAYVTINRPDKKNAMTGAMLDQLMAAYDQAEADDDVRVVVLTGAGDDFSAGHDLSEVGHEYGQRQLDKDGKQRVRLQHDKMYIGRFKRVYESLKPTLSLVKGYTLGAGLYLCEASDLVIGADTLRIGHPEQKMGLSGAAYFAAWEMMQLGPRKARELLLMAEIWDAAKALEVGLVNKVVPADQLDQTGEEWAERIVRLPRDGIVLGKAATNMAMSALGITNQFDFGHVLHTLATNVRYEEDEFNFMKEKRDKGVSQMNKSQAGHYSKYKK